MKKKLLLCPAPQKLTVSEKTHDLREYHWIKIAPEFSIALKRHFIAFADRFAGRFNGELQVSASIPENGNILFEAVLNPDDKKSDSQKYVLSIGRKGIRLSAAGEAGIFYGLQTIAQIIEQCGTLVPEIEIEDCPDFPVRGVMLDISRDKVPKMETLFQLVDLMASLKINHIELYTEHTFAFSAHEIVWRNSSPMTAREIIELDSYCQDRFISLTPNLNSFGHFDRWLKHPEYKQFAECPDGYLAPWGEGGQTKHGSILKPDKESLKLLESLYDEFLPNFSSPLFNVGCDETWELGQGWSANLCKEKGKTKVYLDHLIEINKLVRKNKRKMMFWADIILHEPKYVPSLPPDLIALSWGYEANHPYAKEAEIFKNSGIPFYVCPGTSSWNSLTGRTENCIGNLLNAAENGKKNGAEGFLNTDWGDGGHHQYLPISYLGFLAGAAYSWSVEKSRGIDLQGALDIFVFRDGSGTLGKAAYELGKVNEETGVLPVNAGIFNRLLFWDMTDKKALEGLEAAKLLKCLKRFDELAEANISSKPEIPDGQLVKSELLNSMAMARLGINKALYALGGKIEASRLKKDLLNVISMHEELWLARNRIGGLHESSNRLRSALSK
jgi:hypothetical protein